ncbi:MAG: porin family protein [Saprospiraceae bacterium]
MKKLSSLHIATILLCFAFSANSQISVGVKVGANMADTRVDGSLQNLAPNQTTFAGYTFGVIADIPVINQFSFRPELNYIQKGFTVAQSFDVEIIGIDMPIGAKARTRINYVEMPLLMKYNLGNETAKAYIIAGPNVSYAANAELRPVASLLIDFNLPSINIDLGNNIYNRWELSGTLGAGGEVKAGNGKIFADARYNIGFTNMLNNPVVDLRLKNQGFNLSAGYAYTF